MIKKLISLSVTILIWLCLGFISPVLCQSYNFEVSWYQPETHFFEISLTTTPTPGESTIFQIPSWRPGRYEVMNYALGITDFNAIDEKGNTLKWNKITVNDWEVENPSKGEITISYKFYANVMDAGSSVLNHEQAYINGINLFMHVKERYDAPCILRFTTIPADWKIATALEQAEEENFRTFKAPDYHHLVDAPLILSPNLKTLHFKENEVDYYIHYQGVFAAGQEGEELLLSNVQEIVKEQSALFGGVPFQEYHFLFQFVPEMIGHAVEHSNSSCYVLADAFFKNTDNFNLLNNVLSHEFFHLWNVKRIRPEALWPYNYQEKQYTGLHWFTEGVTSYYADLILVRTGLLTNEAYYRHSNYPNGK